LDQRRNDLIFDDILSVLEEKRSPLVLTERKDHLEYLQDRLMNFARNIIVLQGGLGKKQRLKISEQLKTIPDEEERLILATGRYAGEGFDDARLDTLFLVMPISWRGTLQQYVGRLHRLHDNKRVVQVYDYVDKKVPMLMRMYNKRLIGYKAFGYKIEKPNPNQTQEKIYHG
jgi:superfamily II DNA or RNA helicase